MFDKLSSSPSRTYVIPITVNNGKSMAFKKFTLPDNQENTCAKASWYFFNVLDFVSAGAQAYPYEMHMDIDNMAPAITINDITV